MHQVLETPLALYFLPLLSSLRFSVLCISGVGNTLIGNRRKGFSSDRGQTMGREGFPGLGQSPVILCMKDTIVQMGRRISFRLGFRAERRAFVINT
jgi:hypothetical protein